MYKVNAKKFTRALLVYSLIIIVLFSTVFYHIGYKRANAVDYDYVLSTKMQNAIVAAFEKSDTVYVDILGLITEYSKDSFTACSDEGLCLTITIPTASYKKLNGILPISIIDKDKEVLYTENIATTYLTYDYTLWHRSGGYEIKILIPKIFM